MLKVKSLLILGILFQTIAYADDGIYNTINSGRQTVTTNGTEVQLSSTSTPCTRVVITAETDNTNPVTVGGADVVGALATRKGIPLSAGSSITVRTNNLNKIWIDSVTDTEGVSYIYYL